MKPSEYPPDEMHQDDRALAQHIRNATEALNHLLDQAANRGLCVQIELNEACTFRQRYPQQVLRAKVLRDL